eukprot:TRINITY_DN5463_c0_g1_i1.p1 TRINITY_DN5463_c0_g1~~TRINITY_DN5463_c0_g1_i1.p1  ORF type:complete len:278 (+),score=35.63 TRINITY_DN5463_c0_g1_i1:79-912(+)
MAPTLLVNVNVRGSGKWQAVEVPQSSKVKDLREAIRKEIGVPNLECFEVVSQHGVLTEDDDDRCLSGLGFVNAEELTVRMSQRLEIREELEQAGYTLDNQSMLTALSTSDCWGISMLYKAGIPLFPKAYVSPLHISNLTEECVKLLVSLGCDPNTQDRFGVTALHKAAMTGNNPLVLALIGLGASPLVRDKHGQDPLCYAITRNRSATIRTLVMSGADINSSGDLLTKALASPGRRDTALLLMDLGATVTLNSIFASVKTCNFRVAALQVKKWKIVG